jgi:DNA mismatch endonuclease (patch repair protein)
MKKIRPKNSTQELLVRKIIDSLGLKYTIHDSTLPGCPDIVFRMQKKVIFVNGCFWHGHNNCRKARLPQTNSSFWKKKIQANVKRDARIARRLNRLGWHYKVIWQCRIRGSKTVGFSKDLLRFVQS